MLWDYGGQLIDTSRPFISQTVVRGGGGGQHKGDVLAPVPKR